MTQAYTRVVARGIQFDTRYGTSDAQAIKEVVECRAYTRQWFQVESGERWLDLGVNIGAFSAFAESAGASVVGYEAEATSAHLARRNMELNGFTATIHHAAVVADSYTAPTVPLYLSNTAYGVWRHSLHATKGRRAVEVPAVPISSILAGIDAVKMDIEGVEIEILHSLHDFQGIKKLCFEYHFNVNKPVSLWRHIMERLKHHFSRVHHRYIPDDAEVYNFFPPATIVFCTR